MAKGLNKACLIGNISQDPELKYTPSNTAVCNVSLATSEKFKDKSGEWSEKTEWHNLVAFGKLAEIMRDYCKKGSRIYVEGKIQTQTWEKEGQKRSKTVINISELIMLDGKDGKGKPKESAPAAGNAPDDDSELPF